MDSLTIFQNFEKKKKGGGAMEGCFVHSAPSDCFFFYSVF